MTQQQEKEWLLRGRVISLSAEIETIIVAIIIIGSAHDAQAAVIDLKGKMLGDKIYSAKCILQEYHPEIFSKVNPVFRRYKK